MRDDARGELLKVTCNLCPHPVSARSVGAAREALEAHFDHAHGGARASFVSAGRDAYRFIVEAYRARKNGSA